MLTVDREELAKGVPIRSVPARRPSTDFREFVSRGTRDATHEPRKRYRFNWFVPASNSEARKLIKGGGARLNDAAIGNETRAVTLGDLTADGVVKLSAGKKRHVLVKPARGWGGTEER